MRDIMHRRVMEDGPGTVTFWWKVSSEANYDWLSFYADGVLQDRISGEVGWQQKSYPLGGDGTHALVWVYSKDSGSESGSDRGWVDYLQWTPSGGGGSSTTDWEQITYTYDPSGRRIAKDIDGEVTKYLYDGDQCIAEYDANDVLLRKYVYGPGIDEPICMVEAAGGSAGTYYYHFDALGSVVALSDADGDTVQVYEYDVYGQVAASDPNHPNCFLFTGREFDKETGLYYYRARQCNPTLARFLQIDPLAYADGMNQYLYCHNNPGNLIDPYGTFAFPDFCDVCDIAKYLYNILTGNSPYSTPDDTADADETGDKDADKDPDDDSDDAMPGDAGEYTGGGPSGAGGSDGSAMAGPMPGGQGEPPEYTGPTPPAFGGTPGYEDLWAPEPFKEVYPDIYASGRVSGWKPNPGSSPEPVSVHDPNLKQALRATRPGKWRKMYWKGTMDGRPCEVHYCEHVRTGVVVDVEPVWK